MHSETLILVFVSCSSVYLARGALVNVTVDDSAPDPEMGGSISYAGAWNTGRGCSICRAHPNSSRAYQHTWRDTTYDPRDTKNSQPDKAFFNFNGTLYK